MFSDPVGVIHSETSTNTKWTIHSTPTPLGFIVPESNPISTFSEWRHVDGRYWLSQYTDAVLRDLAVSLARQAYWGLYLALPSWINAMKSGRMFNGLMGYLIQLYKTGQASFIALAPHRISKLASTYEFVADSVKKALAVPQDAFAAINDWYTTHKNTIKEMFHEAKLSLNNGLSRVLGDMGIRLHPVESAALLDITVDEVGGTLQRLGQYELSSNLNLSSFELTVDNFTFTSRYDIGETYADFVNRSGGHAVESVTADEINAIRGTLDDFISESVTLSEVGAELTGIYESVMLESNVLSSINSHHSARLSSVSELVQEDLRIELGLRVSLSNTVAGRSVSMLGKIARNPTAGALVGLGVAYAMGETDPTSILIDGELGVAAASLVDASLTVAKTIMDIRAIKAISRVGGIAEETTAILTRGVMVKSLLSVVGGPAVMAGILAGSVAGDTAAQAYEGIFKAFGVDRDVMDPTKVSTLMYDIGKTDMEVGASMLGFEVAYAGVATATNAATTAIMGTSTASIEAATAEASVALLDAAELIEGAEIAAEATAAAASIAAEATTLAGELAAVSAIEGAAVAETGFVSPATLAVIGIAVVVNSVIIYNYLTTPVPDGNSLHFTEQSLVNSLKGHNLISDHSDSAKRMTPDEIKELGNFYESKIHAFRNSNVIGSLH